MNTIGAILGAVIGWWTVRLAARRGSRDGGGRGRRRITGIWTATAALAIAAWFTAAAIDPIPSDPCDERPAGAATALPGGVSVHAGSRTGHLCIDGPNGDESGLGADPAVGVLETYGGGATRWSIGVAPAGTLTARDDRGARVRTHAVRGTEFRVWSTYRSPASAAPATP